MGCQMPTTLLCVRVQLGGPARVTFVSIIYLLLRVGREVEKQVEIDLLVP